MPELPEVQGLALWLDSLLAGERVISVRTRSIAAIKTFDPPISSLVGQTILSVTRRGKFVIFHASSGFMVVHLSRGGWIRLVESPSTRKPAQRGPIAAEIVTAKGTLDITEHGKEKRLAIWIVRDPLEVPRVATLGPDALAGDFDRQAFEKAVRGREGTIKTVLADQAVIAGIGNAYSDEILHAARISPFTRVSKLTGEQLTLLYDGMKSILSDAVSRASELTGKELKDDKRGHFRVHARAGQSCDVCGDTIREVWGASRSFQYCPGCQTSGRVYADRRLSRLLK